MSKKVNKKQVKIKKVAITDDTISRRGGLILFIKYLENT